MHINNIEWHTLNSEEVAQHLEANPQSGLSPDEARQRLERHGPNRLKEKPKRPAWMKFLEPVGAVAFQPLPRFVRTQAGLRICQIGRAHV